MFPPNPTRRYTVATKAPSKRRDPDPQWLFENPILYKNVKKIQFATTIVGEVFEKVSNDMLGSNWSRLCPEIDADVRPDLGTEDGLNYVESKSTQWRFKVTCPQLRAYRALVSDNAVLKQNCNVNYMLWTYGDKTLRLVEHGKTVEGVVNMLADNVKSVHVIHWSIMAAMLAKTPANVTHNTYPSWKVSIQRGTPFEVMQFGEPFLKRLRENAAKVLFSELSLNPEMYDLRPNHSHRRQSFQFGGKTFNTCRFMVHKFTPIKAYLPFPELSEVNDAIPI